MAAPRIILSSNFELELRAPQRRGFEVLGQTGYVLLQAAETDCFLLNPNESLRIPQAQGEWVWLRLSPQLLIETATRLRLYRTGSNLLFSHAQTSDLKLQSALRSIHTELLEAAAGWQEVVESLVQQLVVQLLRAHVNLKRSEELELSRIGIVDRRLRRALEFMHDHCVRELSLAEIADAAYLSEFHFARLFKKITGTTPHTYLTALRIEQARKLLAETDLAITEVGARVGYNSQSHFTKTFRQATGFTPHTFRAATKL